MSLGIKDIFHDSAALHSDYWWIYNFNYAILRYFNVAGASESGKVGQITNGDQLFKNLAKAVLKINPKKVIKEFRVDQDNILDIGSSLDVSHFKTDQFVDVTSISIGKGFAGAMKRHNFGGLRASHGVSISHRAHGSIGQCQTPGRVWKGKKMSGQMGNERKTIQNLEIVNIDVENNLLFIKGAIPGFNGSKVTIKPSIKKWN